MLLVQGVLELRMLSVLVEMACAVSAAADDDLAGAMLLQAMQTRVSGSLPMNSSVWNGAVIDENGKALMQELRGHPHGERDILGPTPPPPPRADPVWKSPLQNMPVVNHKKRGKEEMNSNASNMSQLPMESPMAAETMPEVQGSAEMSPEVTQAALEPVNMSKNSEMLPEGSVTTSANATASVRRTGPRATSPMAARTAIREHNTGCKHGVSDHEHHSIFKLPFQDLDSLLFWIIFSAMLLFTIVVDRCENTLSRMAAKSKTESMLLQRVNAELMMFGIVGLGVFIGTNIVSDIPADFFRVFEFTDILCSLGACGLIGIASVLFVLRRVMERRWTVLESSLESTQDLVLGANSITDSRKVLVDQTTLRQKEYFVMSRKFIRQQKIPPAFVYSDYLQECLAKNVCNLMDINVISWLVLLSVALTGLIFKAYHTNPMSNDDNLLAFVIVIWSTLVAFLYLMWEVNTARSSLRRHLDISRSLQGKILDNDHPSDENSLRHPDHPKDQSWAWRVNQLLQSLSLFTAFQGAFYLMHMDYNIRLNQFNWAWRVVILFPILWNLCFMLPMIISRFTLVEAYFTPEHDAVDSVLTTMKQHDEDLRYFYNSWIHSGKPTFVDPGMHITFTEFSRVLKRHGMQASGERRQRVFDALDTEKAGVIDVMTLLDELIALDEQEPARSHGGTPRAIARKEPNLARFPG